MADFGDDIQAQLDSLKPQESPYARALKNLLGSPGSDTANYKSRPDAPTGDNYVPRAGGRAHDDHMDFKIGHDPGYQRPPRGPRNDKRSHHG